MKQKVVGNIYIDELDIRDDVGIRPTPSEELRQGYEGMKAFVAAILEQDLGSKDPKTGVLLAYNAKRRHGAG